MFYFEGTMRGLFTLLFGAGVVLYTSRLEKAGLGGKVADYYLGALAAAGQMALTNYLSQSVICLFLFTGAGLGWFGHLQRYELYYVVASIWIVQLLWSPWLLARFQYGPMEWLWRSLTRWQIQPMRKKTGMAGQAGMTPCAAESAHGQRRLP